MSIFDERLKQLEAFLSTKPPDDIISQIESYPASGPYVDDFINTLIPPKETLLIQNDFFCGHIVLVNTLVLSDCSDKNDNEITQPKENDNIEFLSIYDLSSDIISISSNDEQFNSNEHYDLAA
ncbi:TPA: hypothetical protein OUB92_003125 [Morganella morganii]|nr:hypothetical protein [Morganella morganii]